MVAFNPLDPNAAFLIGAGQGLLQAGGWSPAPVGFGQALGMGLQQGQGGYMAALRAQQMEQQRQIQEGMQRAQQARMAAQQRYLAQLPETEQTRAQAMGVEKYMASQMAAPKAPETRKFSLPGGMIQEQQFVGGQWQNVGEPYSRREPFIQVQGTDEQGRTVTQLVPRSDVVAQFSETPQTQQVAVAEQEPGVRRITVATGGKLTEAQRRAAGFASRMVQSSSDIEGLIEGGANYPALTQALAASGVPFTNFTLSPEEQQIIAAATEFTRAFTRKESGAVIGADEVRDTMRSMFPVPGDSPETIAYKNRLRQRVIDSVVSESGGLYEEQFAPSVEVEKTTAAPTMEAGTAGAQSIEQMSDQQVLTIPPASVKNMSQAERDVLDARLKAMGY